MDCPICYDNVLASETGCYEMSCSHKFHPTCLMTWFTKNSVSTCPMCRHEAGPLERLPVVDDEEDDEDDDDESEEEDEEDDTEFMAITRQPLTDLLIGFGATGVNDNMMHMFDEEGLTIINAMEFGFISMAQGGRRPSELEWAAIVPHYPVQPTAPVEAAADRELEEAIAFADGLAVLSRGAIESLLHRQGSAATVSEFLNEDLGDDEEPIQAIAMTQTSLNARLTSLGVEPVSSGFFQDLRTGQQESLTVSVEETGERSVIPKPRILNPEEDAELGPA